MPEGGRNVPDGESREGTAARVVTGPQAAEGRSQTSIKCTPKRR
jgi:hypothetical protein